MLFFAFSLFFSDLIPPQENKEDLETYLEAFREEEYDIIEADDFRFFLRPGESLDEDEEVNTLIKRYAKNGSTVVEYGAKKGAGILHLIPLLGPLGRVIVFESDPLQFRQLYWNFRLNNVQNAQMYCKILGEKEKTLDLLRLENVSLIRIDASGREDIFLRGAESTIKRNRPVLIINVLGGIPLEYSDRFVKKVYEDRLEMLHRMGYSTQCIRKNLYLALPK